MIDSKKIKDIIINGDGSITVLTIDGYDRYTANGIVSSIIDIEGKRNDRTKEETQKKMDNFLKKHGDFEEHKNRITFTVWDMITVDEYFDKKSLTPYNIRFFRLIEILNTSNLTNVQIIKYKVVANYTETMNHFKELISNGEEGTILKSFDGIWKDGKVPHQVKIKIDIDLDLKIVGFKYGTKGTKNENVISTLITKSSCGKLSTNPSGMNEEMMKYVTDNQDNLLGTIVEIRCCGLSQNIDGDYSTLHPSVVGLRDDKSEANSLEECIQINNAAIGLS